MQRKFNFRHNEANIYTYQQACQQKKLSHIILTSLF